MIKQRKSSERGLADHGWLQSRHSFSFASYHDPAHMQFGPLRVINDDYIAPGMGFGTHPHRDMEIISYVLAGKLEHRDNMGNTSVIEPGNIQRMSAGTGVLHSEYNPSTTETTHLLQIWIIPEIKSLPPSYEERICTPAEKRGRLNLIAASAGEGAAVTVHQDVHIYAGLFDKHEHAKFEISPTRKIYLHLARGSLVVNALPLQAGDALMIEDENQLTISDGIDAEVLVFELP